MTDAATIALITSLAGVAVALLGYLGVRFVPRISQRARREEQVNQANSELTRGWRELVDQQQESITAIHGRAEVATRLAQAATEKVAEIETALDTERRARQDLDHKLTGAFAYIRTLLSVLKRHEIDPPAPPAGLEVWE